MPNLPEGSPQPATATQSRIPTFTRTATIANTSAAKPTSKIGIPAPKSVPLTARPATSATRPLATKRKETTTSGSITSRLPPKDTTSEPAPRSLSVATGAVTVAATHRLLKKSKETLSASTAIPKSSQTDAKTATLAAVQNDAKSSTTVRAKVSKPVGSSITQPKRIVKAEKPSSLDSSIKPPRPLQRSASISGVATPSSLTPRPPTTSHLSASSARPESRNGNGALVKPSTFGSKIASGNSGNQVISSTMTKVTPATVSSTSSKGEKGTRLLSKAKGNASNPKTTERCPNVSSASLYASILDDEGLQVIDTVLEKAKIAHLEAKELIRTANVQMKPKLSANISVASIPASCKEGKEALVETANAVVAEEPIFIQEDLLPTVDAITDVQEPPINTSSENNHANTSAPEEKLENSGCSLISANNAVKVELVNDSLISETNAVTIESNEAKNEILVTSLASSANQPASASDDGVIFEIGQVESVDSDEESVPIASEAVYNPTIAEKQPTLNENSVPTATKGKISTPPIQHPQPSASNSPKFLSSKLPPSHPALTAPSSTAHSRTASSFFKPISVIGSFSTRSSRRSSRQSSIADRRTLSNGQTMNLEEMEAQRQMWMEDYMRVSTEEVLEWLSRVTCTELPQYIVARNSNTSDSDFENLKNAATHSAANNEVSSILFDSLQTGILLCKLVNAIKADLKLRHIASAFPGTFHARDNIAKFLNVIESWEMPRSRLFEVDDLVMRKHDRRVVNALLDISRLAYIKFGIEPPLLIKYEFEIADLEKQQEETPSQLESQSEESARPTPTIAVEKIELASEVKEKESPLPKGHIQPPTTIKLPDITMPVPQLEETPAEPSVKEPRKPRWLPYIAVPTSPLDVAVGRTLNGLEIDCYVKRVTEGQYIIGVDEKVSFVRLVRHLILVRVGGGWEAFVPVSNRKVLPEEDV